MTTCLFIKHELHDPIDQRKSATTELQAKTKNQKQNSRVDSQAKNKHSGAWTESIESCDDDLLLWWREKECILLAFRDWWIKY